MVVLVYMLIVETVECIHRLEVIRCDVSDILFM